MDKSFAIEMLGGPREAARWLGLASEKILAEWPPVFASGSMLEDRFIAARNRQAMATTLGVSCEGFFADARNQALLEKMLGSVAFASVYVSLMPRMPPEFARRVPTVPPGSKRRGRPPLNPPEYPADAVTG